MTRNRRGRITLTIDMLALSMLSMLAGRSNHDPRGIAAGEHRIARGADVDIDIHESVVYRFAPWGP